MLRINNIIKAILTYETLYSLNLHHKKFMKVGKEKVSLEQSSLIVWKKPKQQIITFRFVPPERVLDLFPACSVILKADI